MLIFDFLILNRDRHLRNFGLLYNEITKIYRIEPLFDHGQSFLLTESTLTVKEYTERIRKFKSGPFSANPVKNMGDLSYVRMVYSDTLRVCGGKDRIKNLKIRDGHKRTIIRQMNSLEEMLNTR